MMMMNICVMYTSDDVDDDEVCGMYVRHACFCDDDEVRDMFLQIMRM